MTRTIYEKRFTRLIETMLSPIVISHVREI